MDNVFVARLRALTDVRSEDVDALTALLSVPKTVDVEYRIAAEGDRPRRLHMLLDGWAARVKMLRDGGRHFVALILPGDLCDVDTLHVEAYGYGVVALTRCTFASIDRRALLTLCERHPRVGRALAWLAFVDNAMLIEASTSLARRPARQRLGHLLCELRTRLEVIGQGERSGFRLPLTQDRIADAIGLTGVHVNRTFRQLRAEGLINVAGQFVSAPDWDALERDAGFAAGYLHLTGMRIVSLAA